VSVREDLRQRFFEMIPLFRQSDAAFEQQTANLIDDCGSPHHPSFPDAMHCLQIELRFRLWRYKTHRGALNGFSNRVLR